MSQFAMITGDVTYTPGDGAPIEIPRVRVEVELAPDSASKSDRPSASSTIRRAELPSRASSRLRKTDSHESAPAAAS